MKRSSLVKSDTRMRGPVIAAVVLAATAIAVAGAGAAASKGAHPAAIDPNASIRIGTPASMPTLDPAKFSGANNVGYSVWDRLTTLDSKGNVRPMLATSWSFAKDAKSITFNLRKDVKFHDGTPLDATAVKASIDRAINLPGSAVASTLADVDSVDVVNRWTVRVNLKFGGAELPAVFATNAGAVINPSCIAKNTPLDQPPPECSSGGMVVDHATPPLEWYLKKAPGTYWDPKAFHFANLTVLTVGNVQTRINGILSGDLDVADITPDGMAQARAVIRGGQAGGKAFASPALNAIELNPRHPPFDNPLVRKAVQAAIDPKPIANNLLAGNCVPSQQPAESNSVFFNKNFKETNPYNPDKAKQYLAQAGLPNGFSFTDTVVNQSMGILVSQVEQDQLAKVGIKANIQLVNTTSDAAIRLGTTDAFSAAWLNGTDPSQTVEGLVIIPDLRIASALGSPVENQLQTLRFHALDPRLTPQQRGKVYWQIWKIVYDNALVVNVCNLGRISLHGKNILNADLPPYALLSAGNDPRYIEKTH
jgi:peptide/nickel transport system substrate-binding protein